MNNGTFTEEELKNNPKYGYWTSKDYVDQFGKFVADCQQVADLVKAQYNDQKISSEIKSLYDNFDSEYTSIYQNTVNSLQGQLDTIKNSYEDTTDPVYSDATSALNELIRRQNFKAKLALMSENQLKGYMDNAPETMMKLPLSDQKAVLDEFHNRKIKYDEAVIRDAQQNRYKADPNFQRLSSILSNAWTVTPNGKNTTLAYFLLQSDGTYTLNFVYVSVLDKIGHLPIDEATNTVNKLQQGLSSLRKLGSQNSVNQNQSKIKQASELVDTYVNGSQKYKIADNDPRINESGSHWRWTAFYEFLQERFGNDQVIVSNPVYSDITNPNYDIDKRYHAMKGIYETQLTNHQYHPVKIIKVPGDKNPEELSDKDIIKLFGAID